MSTQVASKHSGAGLRVQKFGAFLSGMVMPNIGAFIAWGIITALFIPTGWTPNESLGQLVGPAIKWLLPLLVAYTGGTLIYGRRGGLMGAICATGIIVGSDVPMFLGAMIMGPLGAWIIKKVDEQFEGKVKPGFEMLVNNFSAGIVGAVLMILGYLVIGPVMMAMNGVIAAAVDVVIKHGLLPLASIFVCPAQVLFLNNAVNHGILVPLGVQQASELGRSLLFLVEANNGPMAGILLAYWLFGRGVSKATAPGSLIIVLFGGIGEVYFPYVLRKPILIIAHILGSMSALFTWGLFHTGLVAAPSPGSIFAVLAMTPKGHYFQILVGFIVGIVVAFVVGAFLIKKYDQVDLHDSDDDSLARATATMEGFKGQKSKYADSLAAGAVSFADKLAALKNKQGPLKVIFACDAGMGSSAMSASILTKKLKEGGIDCKVINKAVADIPPDADIVVTHRDLTERAKHTCPNAAHVSIDNYLNAPEYDVLVKELQKLKS